MAAVLCQKVLNFRLYDLRHAHTARIAAKGMNDMVAAKIPGCSTKAYERIHLNCLTYLLQPADYFPALSTDVRGTDSTSPMSQELLLRGTGDRPDWPRFASSEKRIHLTAAEVRELFML